MQKGFMALIALCVIKARAAEAQESKVTLVTDKSVYASSDGQSITIRLKNDGTQSVAAGSLNIFRGDQLVFAALNASPIPPGQSKVWTWNKKSLAGDSVGPGTYRIWVGPNGVGAGPFYRNLLVALTPSGRLAGKSRFPLSIGNEWTFRTNLDGSLTMKVSKQESGWYRVSNLAGANRWARMWGELYPTLFVKLPGAWGPLFGFQRPQGSVYGSFPPFNNFKVGAVNETVMTPAGTFVGCYRLDVLQGGKSFWFAPGVGMVRFSVGVTDFRLRRAKVKGTDGAVYAIGLPD